MFACKLSTVATFTQSRGVKQKLWAADANVREDWEDKGGKLGERERLDGGYMTNDLPCPWGLPGV